MKFLQTIRFDPSDTHVFARAALPDEWALPGSFCFAHYDRKSLHGKQKQAFSNGFWSLQSQGFSTFVTVCQINEAQLEICTNELAQIFLQSFGAPNLDEAMQAATNEVDYVVQLCEQVPINSVFSLNRSFNDDNEIIENFHLIDAPVAPTHARVWEIVEDEVK